MSLGNLTKSQLYRIIANLNMVNLELEDQLEIDEITWIEAQKESAAMYGELDLVSQESKVVTIERDQALRDVTALSMELEDLNEGIKIERAELFAQQNEVIDRLKLAESDIAMFRDKANQLESDIAEIDMENTDLKIEVESLQKVLKKKDEEIKDLENKLFRE